MMRNLTRRQKSTMPTAQERRTLFWPIQYKCLKISIRRLKALFQLVRNLKTLRFSVDIIDTKDSIKIETELPGMGLCLA